MGYFQMSASCRTIHEYLGMTIDRSDKGMVKFTTYNFLEDIIPKAPDNMHEMNVTPAANNLVKTYNASLILNEEKTDKFHRVVALFLYAAKQARPDI